MSQIVVDASVELPGQMNFDFGFEDVDAMLLDPPDPVDLLIAHTHEPQGAARPLDFVRAKMSELKKENSRLKSRRGWDLESRVSRSMLFRLCWYDILMLV